MKIFNYIVVLFVLLILVFPSYSRTHVSVPLGHPVYEFLESAQILGFLEKLPAVKPYPESLVVSSLRQIEQRRSQLFPNEQRVLDDFLLRFASEGDNEGFLESGQLKWENPLFPVQIGIPINLGLSQDVTDRDSTYLQLEIEPYIKGDAGRYISYYLMLRGGLYILPGRIYTINPPVEEPYSFSKRWDTALHPASSNIGAYNSWASDEEPNNLGIEINVEIRASFWDNKLDIRFGRMRHEWGYGEGSLYMDALARPFTGLELTARPLKWLDISAIYGMLEYYVYPGQKQPNEWSQTLAEDQQNNYALFQLDIRPFNWLTISFIDAAIFTKRLDLAYMIPFFPRTFAQHYTGDFDNLVMGGMLVLDWPKLFRFYAGLFIDEWNILGENFFNLDRNMYALQAGLKVPLRIGNLPWSRVAFQYTKIEPYTYTHPPAKVPGFPNQYGGVRHPSIRSDTYDNMSRGADWDGFNMETGYINNGEPMGYHLEPNSDEFLLTFTTRPWNWIKGSFKYRLIRHGVAGQVDGSSYLDYIPYYTYKKNSDGQGSWWYDDELYKKDFLKDGLYEWYHVFAISSDMDLTLITRLPMILNLKYALVYQYHTDYSSNNNYDPVDDSFDNVRHIFSLNLQIFPF